MGDEKVKDTLAAWGKKHANDAETKALLAWIAVPLAWAEHVIAERDAWRKLAMARAALVNRWKERGPKVLAAFIAEADALAELRKMGVEVDDGK